MSSPAVHRLNAQDVDEPAKQAQTLDDGVRFFIAPLVAEDTSND
jgi:hypothetical protein